MMKFSTVCPIYKDRKQQLFYALKAYNDQDFDKNEFEVIIVDQGNDENIQELFSQYNINIQYIKVDLSLVGYEGARNPSYAQNVAIKKARGEYIVLTSPEVCFENLAFKKMSSSVAPNVMKYCSVGECRSLSLEGTYTHQYLLQMMTGIWLCHPQHRAATLAYFMGIVHRDVLFKINGVDEDFMHGISYEDNDFANRIGHVALRNFDINILGMHLDHCRSYQADGIKQQYSRTLLERKQSMPQYQIVANVGKDWGSDKGIIDHIFYDWR